MTAEHCASAKCTKPAVYEFVSAGDVASVYCAECTARICRLAVQALALSMTAGFRFRRLAG